MPLETTTGGWQARSRSLPLQLRRRAGTGHSSLYDLLALRFLCRAARERRKKRSVDQFLPIRRLRIPKVKSARSVKRLGGDQAHRKGACPITAKTVGRPISAPSKTGWPGL